MGQTGEFVAGTLVGQQAAWRLPDLTGIYSDTPKETVLWCLETLRIILRGEKNMKIIHKTGHKLAQHLFTSVMEQ